MDEIVPWGKLSKLIEPYYPKMGNGRPAIALERMLRIPCLRPWNAISGPTMEEALYDVEPMRRFAGIDLQSKRERDPEMSVNAFREIYPALHIVGPLSSLTRSASRSCSGTGHECR